MLIIVNSESVVDACEMLEDLKSEVFVFQCSPYSHLVEIGDPEEAEEMRELFNELGYIVNIC